MNEKEFIDSIITSIVNRMNTFLSPIYQQHWLSEKEPEITAEVDTRFKAETDKIEREQREKLPKLETDLKEAKSELSRHQSPPINPNTFSTIILRNKIAQLENDILTLKSKSTQRSFFVYQVKQEYQTKVSNLWRITLNPTLTERFKKTLSDQFHPTDLLKQLFQRHPWLQEAGWSRSTTGVVGTFLLKILERGFFDGMKNFKFESTPVIKLSLTASDKENIAQAIENPSRFEWDEIDASWLQQEIEGHPFTKIVEFYNGSSEYFNVDNSMPSRWENYSFTVIDVFRALLKCDASLTNTALIDNVTTPIAAPLFLDELQKISPERWAHLKVVFIQLHGTWILLHKVDNKWIGYKPKNGSWITDAELVRVKSDVPGFGSFQDVEYKDNLHTNDLVIREQTAWHAVLFSRVLPWCLLKTPKDITLSQYHARFPMPILLQNAYENAASPSGWQKRLLATIFVFRNPLTELEMNDFYKKLYYRQDSHVYNMGDWETKCITTEFTTSFLKPEERDELRKILSSSASFTVEFNNNRITLDLDASTLSLKGESTPYQIKEIDSSLLVKALHLLTTYSNFSRLSYPNYPLTYGDKNQDLLRSLFAANISLKTIIPKLESHQKPLPGVFSYATHCAARNRFLQIVAPHYLNTLTKSSKNREVLWQQTGEYILSFFKNPDNDLTNLDHIAELIAFNRAWRKANCDHEYTQHTPLSNQSLWGFAQIATMGTTGIDQFFNTVDVLYSKRWEEQYKEPAPELSCTFDLAGGQIDTPADYIKHLSEKIKVFSGERKPSPLFKSLGLILPDKLDYTDVEAFIALLRELNSLHCKSNNVQRGIPEDIPEVALYNLDNISGSSGLLDRLATLALDKGWRLLIRIPAWDRMTYTDINEAERKVVYRNLQNKIMDNKRTHNDTLLVGQMKNLYVENLTAEVLLEQREGEQEQPFDGEDQIYPLSGARGTQYQQQQQQQQQQQMQQEEEEQQEEEQEEEQEQEIHQYAGNEDDLITRDNIDERCSGKWSAVPTEIKEYSGWKKNSLKQLFSLWVGSDKPAPLVIEKIEPAAADKIMEYASQFRQGFSVENLPPGFFLSFSPQNKGRILCFDKKREKRDLYARELLSLKRQNPFTVLLQKPAPAVEMRGDYKQFSPITTDVEQQKTLWKFLVTQKKDEQHLQLAKRALGNAVLDDSNTTSMAQALERNESTLAPKERSDCLLTLQAWANKGKVLPELVNLIFSPNSTSALSEANLKSFGQLFHHYDKVDLPEGNGTRRWALVAEKIYKTFGEAHFLTWKKRLLDPSPNWKSCLEKKEIDALKMSILTLNNKDIQTIWWKLVDAHGEATGPMSYAAVWYSFQKVLKFMERRNLKFDFDALARYVQKTPDFNAVVFLDRLHTTFKKSSKALDNDIIHKDILTHLDKIDWTHSGFYYASRYEGFTYWDERSQFHKLMPVNQTDQATYQVHWEPDTEVTDVEAQALRFANQRMLLPVTEFNALKALLPAFREKSPSILRLFVACNALGLESLESYSIDSLKTTIAGLASQPSELINWLNNEFLLEGKLARGSLKARWEDLPLILQAIFESGIYLERIRLSPLAFINACGHAIQCYRYHGANERTTNSNEHCSEKLKKLLKKLDEQRVLLQQIGFEEATACPWITETTTFLSSNNPQTKQFMDQLVSLDPENTKYWPDHSEVHSAVAQISKTGANARRKIIQDLITKGCAIRYQDAPFRLLNEQERMNALIYYKKKSKPLFTTQNEALFQRFIQQHLAVAVEGDTKQQINKLIDNLLTLDNKPYFNELGQILGLLLKKASKHPQRYYSAEQLNGWLTLLTSAQFETQHYPINLLAAVLNDNISRENGSLLNISLFKLSNDSENQKSQQAIRKINELTLPNLFKSTLAQLILEAKDDQQADWDYADFAIKLLSRMHSDKYSHKWMQLTERLLKARLPKSIIENLTNRVFGEGEADATLRKLWEKTQINRGELLLKETVCNSEKCTTGNQAYKLMILQNAKGGRELLVNCNNLLNKLDPQQLKDLAQYYATEPRPSFDQLERMLRTASQPIQTQDLIHIFESQYQAESDSGSKRQYSLTPEDQASLLRVIGGFKRKGQQTLSDEEGKTLLNLLAYTNHYSQLHGLQTAGIHQLQARQALIVNMLQTLPEGYDKSQKAAELLACMREILLRKSGKWANHTQMLDLLYSALHNDVSLIHQVRTGQGKSIISAMRAGYLALNGFTVDVFSAKESLSSRDHEEFEPFLDGLGIPSAYIAANSPAKAYITNTTQIGYGAIHYATPGNMSLFLSGQAWQGKHAIQTPKKRAAFIDEADYALLEDNVQFNYSWNADGDSIYNLDEWVYRVVCEFYIENKDQFERNAAGAPIIHRNTELKALTKLLQAKLIHAPKQSQFFTKFMSPALRGDEAMLIKRDQQLVKLLKAAHLAHGLQENKDYSTQPDSKAVGGGNSIEARAGKVVIDNQLRPGSTYSELVQEMLHVFLNMKAAQQGEAPDFFVDPPSSIVMSSNVEYMLKNYQKVEGCTGTAGNSEELKVFEKTFGIKHVVKLPTHEEIRTTFLPTIFSDSEDFQIEELIRCCEEYKALGPILITCEDDIAVKRFAEKIKQKSPQLKLTIDTNDSGLSERDIVPNAGKIGSIVISARMGRGTDIKPEGENGLMVLRTYPIHPRIEKQEKGRQGRNGAAGSCQNILNYQKIEMTFKRYHRLNPSRVKSIYAQQEQHLLDKLKKHEDRGSSKWQWLASDPDQQSKYLKTRTIAQFAQELKHENEYFLRKKEGVLAVLSGHIKDELNELICENNAQQHEQLRESWIQTLKNIEALWNGRLAGQPKGDTEEIYTQFLNHVHEEWLSICAKHRGKLNRYLLEGQDISTPSAENNPEAFLDKLLNEWKIQPYSPKQMEEIYSLRKLITKKILVKYHADKVAPELKDQYIAIVQKANNFKALIDKIINHNKGHAPEPRVIPEVGDHPEGTWALMPYTKKAHTATPDLPNVINFYQAYLLGCQKYYFNADLGAPDEAVVNAIYRPGDEDLNLWHYPGASQLYKTLFSSSAAQITEAKKAQRIRIFTALSDLTKQPTFYSVIGVKIGDLLERLLSLKTEKLDEMLPATSDFFTHFLPEAKTPKQWVDEDPDHIRKIGDLLDITLDIANSKFITDNGESLRFLKTFRKVIYNHFWTKINPEFVTTMRIIFANTPECTELLTRHTNESDLIYFIGSLFKKEYSVVTPETIKAYGDQLARHMQDHFKTLNTNPGLLRPLISLTVGNPFAEANFLPSPDCLPNLTPYQKSQFWNFLVERQPIKEVACMDLIEKLALYENTPAFSKDVLEPLFKLPAHLSLDYIHKHPSLLQPGKAHFADVKANVEALSEKVAIFNTFLAANKIVHDKKRADHNPLLQEDYKKWVSYFENTPADKSDVFFEEALKYKLRPQALSMIAEAWKTKKKISDEATLQEALRLGQMITDDDTFTSVFSFWVKQDDKRETTNHYEEIFKKIKTIETLYPNMLQFKLREQYLRAVAQPESITRYETLLDVLVDTKNTLAPSAMIVLANAFINQVIQTKQQLLEAIDVTNKAESFKTGRPSDWHEKFADESKPAKQDRVKIMQYLYHDILDLGADFKHKFEEKYEKTMGDKLNDTADTSRKQTKGESPVKARYALFADLAQQMRDIVTHPFQEKPARQDNGAISPENKQKHGKQITQSLKDYGRLWSTNSTRRRQAKDLLFTLGGTVQQGYIDISTYYQSMLRNIAQTQQAILASDVIHSRHNKKGYSRLYDICNHLFVTIATDYLRETGPSAQRSAFIDDHLKELLEQNIITLCDRLPKSKALDGLRESMDKRNQTPEDFWFKLETVLNKIELKSIPKNMHYLIENSKMLTQAVAKSMGNTPPANRP